MIILAELVVFKCHSWKMIYNSDWRIKKLWRLISPNLNWIVIQSWTCQGRLGLELNTGLPTIIDIREVLIRFMSLKLGIELRKRWDERIIFSLSSWM